MQHSTWHELIKKELPEDYFGQINQFMDFVRILTMVRIKHKACHFQYQKTFQLRHLCKIF